MTDQDPGMKAAIKSAWPGCNHLNCAYHLFCNIKKNITYPVFGGKKSFKKGDANDPRDKALFHKKWWIICKKTDVQSIETFDQEWQELNSLILKQFHNDDKAIGYLNAKEHMDTLYKLRERWACRWTWAYRTGGATSSSRAECIHAVMKGRINGRRCKRYLKDLVRDVESWVHDVADNSMHRDFRTTLRNATKDKVVTMAIPNLDVLEKHMSNYGFGMLREQILLSHKCEVKKLDGEEQPHSKSPLPRAIAAILILFAAFLLGCCTC